MRALTVTALSSLASIWLAITARSYALRIDLSQAISPAMFTNLLIVSLCVLATLACLWIALSYLSLAYAQRATGRKNAFISFFTRFATPRVRRTLAGGAIALSLVIPQPAYAEDYGDTGTEELSDISWGSPDLLEITVQSDTVTDTNDTPDAPAARELPQHSQSPPPAPTPPNTPPASYTVKSGDTLWDIAKAHLPPDTTDSDIAQACLLWAQANPQLTNPNLIYPGQPLTIP